MGNFSIKFIIDCTEDHICYHFLKPKITSDYKEGEQSFDLALLITIPNSRLEGLPKLENQEVRVVSWSAKNPNPVISLLSISTLSVCTQVIAPRKQHIWSRRGRTDAAKKSN